MAGHNKWSKVKHRKAVVDKRRGKALSMCSRAIISAARQGGPDPNFNAALRAAIEEARYHNVPGDNIERAIRKGAGGGDGENFEPVRYEGYGPGGVAVIVEALTDNRTRTAANVRNIFGDHAGKMGTTGSVIHMFRHAGRIEVDGVAGDDDRVLEAALAAGAEDARKGDDGAWEVECRPEQLHAVRAALRSAGLKTGEAGLDMIPALTVTLDGPTARSLLELIDALEDDEDVKKVYSNADIPESVLAAMGD